MDDVILAISFALKPTLIESINIVWLRILFRLDPR